jgi:GGDEF domain-containing protein
LSNKISGSLDIAIHPKDGEDLQTLLKAADLKIYQVKKSGRHNYRLNLSNTHLHDRARLVK